MNKDDYRWLFLHIQQHDLRPSVSWHVYLSQHSQVFSFIILLRKPTCRHTAVCLIFANQYDATNSVPTTTASATVLTRSWILFKSDDWTSLIGIVNVAWFLRTCARTFTCVDIHINDLTPDEELNILTHGKPFWVIIYRSYRLVNVVQFIDPPQYVGATPLIHFHARWSWKRCIAATEASRGCVELEWCDPGVQLLALNKSRYILYWLLPFYLNVSYYCQ